MNDLRILGISEKEQLVYRTLLSTGSLSAREVAKATKIKRPTVYIYLENLKEIGLISETFSENKKYFKAVNPKALSQIVKSKMSELQILERNIPSLVEQLEEVTKSKDLSSDQIYQGETGLRALVEEIANTKADTFFLGSNKNLEQIIPSDEWEKIYNRPRRKKMVNEYVITDYAKRSIQRYLEESGTFTKYRFLPPNYNFNAAFAVIGKKLMIIKFKPKLQIAVFEDQSLVAIFKLAFISLWKDLEGKNIPPPR
jgi:sugar-specific transcriptional regulator TrmB